MTERSIERALVGTAPYLVGGLVVSPLLLLVAVPTSPLAVFTAHLTALVALSIAVSARLAGFADAPWFVELGWVSTARRMATAAVLVVLPTGLVALVTLASSAALRYDPSLQFLQLLSALDIAWAAAALFIGVRWLWGPRAALAAAVVLGVACVVSVGNYLRVVGFGPGGAWIVDGGDLMRLVLPFDMVAAVVAITALVAGARRDPGAR